MWPRTRLNIHIWNQTHKASKSYKWNASTFTTNISLENRRLSLYDVKSFSQPNHFYDIQRKRRRDTSTPLLKMLLFFVDKEQRLGKRDIGFSGPGQEIERLTSRRGSAFNILLVHSETFKNQECSFEYSKNKIGYCDITALAHARILTTVFVLHWQHGR